MGEWIHFYILYSGVFFSAKKMSCHATKKGMEKPYMNNIKAASLLHTVLFQLYDMPEKAKL